jgi:hypothetical protein
MGYVRGFETIQKGNKKQMSHFCHAEGCDTPVPPVMFMCKPHWYTLHKYLRELVLRYYVPKQEVHKNPSLEYLTVAGWSILYVATIEMLKTANKNTPSYVYAALNSRRSRDIKLCMRGCNKDLVLWLRKFYMTEFTSIFRA